MDLSRFETLIGKDNLSKVRNLNVLIVGIGGVGGYTLESLIRSGINNITIVDYDTIDSSNLNRQIITNNDNIGNYKVDEALIRYKKINNDLNLKAYRIKIDEETIDDIDFDSFDYIVDACDDVLAKEMIINEALRYKKTVISAMGTAKKLDATKLVLTTLDKTSYDPLAKKMRKLIGKDVQKKVHVVTSSEEPAQIESLGSTSYVPGVAGLLITNFIINDTIK